MPTERVFRTMSFPDKMSDERALDQSMPYELNLQTKHAVKDM
jgi:hypothetical protein